MVKLLDAATTTGCATNTGATGSLGFGISENLNDTQHMRFSASIPKKLLSETNKADMVISLYDNGTGQWKSYPSDKDLFEDTYTIIW